MKAYSSNNLALLFSVVLSFLLTGFSSITNLYYYHNIQWLHATGVFVITLTISYFALRFIFFKFIYDRIKLIYKSIHTKKEAGKNFSTKFNMRVDMIEQVDNDVTEWADEQSKVIEQLRQMARYRKEFIGNISHELKTPIFNIQGYTSTLLEGGLEDESINKKYLSKIDKNINKMISIVNDLEAISKLESSTLKFDLKPVDPERLITEVMESLEDRADEKNISMQVKRHYDKNRLIEADKHFLSQVFANLILNAINYSNPGGFVKIEMFDMDKHILFEVTDNGIGIPAEDLPRVFERFYRVDKSHSSNTGGSGLGLAIVKHIIEAHNQKVNIRSTPGIGTTVAFTMKAITV
ncbi:MAG TPA: ATP-binding protein [Bacteroidales bacterium]|nr:ATP-binding protein [Bacteroidales bacterium]